MFIVMPTYCAYRNLREKEELSPVTNAHRHQIYAENFIGLLGTKKEGSSLTVLYQLQRLFSVKYTRLLSLVT